MKPKFSAPLLVTFALVGIFLLQCGHKGSIKTGSTRDRLTVTKAMVTGGRNGSSFAPLSQFEVDGVEKFVLFIGNTRSGHSIIAAMMDAHPNIVIAHEYHVLQPCVLQGQSKLQPKAALFSSLYQNSYKQSKDGFRGEKHNYNGHINTPWQGRFSQLRVIGDKNGGDVSESFAKHHENATQCFKLLQSTIKVPIVMFHVVRNPFDMIAKKLALEHGVHYIRKMQEEGKKFRPKTEDIMRVAAIVFNKAEAFEAIHSNRTKDLVVMEIHIENFIKHPREHIKEICETLSVPCPTEYVEACYEKVFSKVSKSRELIEWDNDVVKHIRQMMKRFPFFSAYTLNS